MEREPSRKRCLWCPNAEGCSSCSMSGDDPRSYQLIPLTMVDEQLDSARRSERQKWVGIVIVLGFAVTGLVALLLALLAVVAGIL
jgi:hypothetical protein